jgi:hypothetical protein
VQVLRAWYTDNMAINVNLAQLSTLNNTSILGQVNSNNAILQAALPDALSRSGASPNQMGSNLDMNANQILNLPPPGTANSPARLVDVVSNPNLLLTVPPTGTSGATVGFLNGNNTYSGTSTFTNTVTLPTNTVLHGNQLIGTTTNDNATAGNIGEYVSSTVLQASAIPFVSNTSTNITSISLTAGDWDVWGNVAYIAAASTNVTYYQGVITTTSAGGGLIPGAFYAVSLPTGIVPGTFPIGGLTVGPTRFSLASTTTIFLTGSCNFSVSTLSAYGIIQARRVR